MAYWLLKLPNASLQKQRQVRMLDAKSRNMDFPALREQIYLDTGAEGIPPPGVLLALERYVADKATGVKGRVQHFAELERCREITARFLHLEPTEVGFCSCSAEAYNLLSTALRATADDEIVLNEFDYPSGSTPWLSPNCRAQIRMWKARSGRLDLADLRPLLSSRTRLVQVSLVSFYNGLLLDWNAFVEQVRATAPQAIVAVDVTQALGRCVIDCSDADFIVSSTHKWALGIHGTGIVGVPRRRASELTTRAGGWFHLDNAFAADRFGRAAIKAGAASYACGMPSFAPIYALNAALRYLDGVGVSEIATHADKLVDQLKAGLAELPVEMLTGPVNRSVAVNFNIDRVRVSIHGYNTAADIETFLSAFKRVLKSA
jgi:cysteine desulfurase/selenocysteine lyase